MMRFLTTAFLLLPLVTVSGVVHHHDEQHVMDMTQEQQQRTETQTQILSHAQIQQEIQAEHAQQIQQQVQQLTELQQHLQAEVEADADAEVDAEGEQKFWPFDEGLGRALKEKFTTWYESRKPIDPNTVLMKEVTLVRATETTPKGFKHNILDIKPFTSFEINTLQTIHNEWLKSFGWLSLDTSGYEFNWARMFEPFTKQYRSYVPAVKSQRCGTCWDFSTSAMISSHMAIKYSIDRPLEWHDERVNPISLSEGELFECTGKSKVDDVCNGNWIQNAAARVIATGIAQNVDYTFSGKLEINANRCRGNACGPKCPVKPPDVNAKLVKDCNYWPQKCPSIKDKRRSNNPRFKIDKLVTMSNPSKDPTKPTSPWIGTPSNPLQTEQIREVLRTKGPVGFYFRVESGFGLSGNDVWPNNGAVYDTPCTGVGINHAMLIVGYGRTSAKNAQPNMDYWIVLNSWGNWSTDGFIKIKAGVNLCGAENIAFYPELPPVDVAASDPCASQPSEKKKIACFLSLCDNTVLSTSRYCQSKGRSNYCKRIVDTKTCPKECGTCAKTLDKAALKACKAKYNTGKCSTECKFYDKMCRINFSLDDKVFWKDILLPLNTKIAEAKIGTPIDNVMIAKVDSKPIKTFMDVYQGGQNGNQGSVLV